MKRYTLAEFKAAGVAPLGCDTGPFGVMELRCNWSRADRRYWIACEGHESWIEFVKSLPPTIPPDPSRSP